MKNKKVFGILLSLTFVLSIASIATINLTPASAAPVSDHSTLTFTVLPDGSVEISGSQYAPYTGSNSTESLFISDDTILSNYLYDGISTSDYYYREIVLQLVDNVFTISGEMDNEYNMTGAPDLTASVSFNYDGNTATLSLTENMPNINLTDLIGNMTSPLPFEIPSFSGTLSINNGVITGSITLQANELFGSPMTININIDNTNVRAYGSGGLVYQGADFNSTHLDYFDAMFDNFTGTGSGSIYNITSGVLLATLAQFSYTNTTFTAGSGATITFDLQAQNTTFGIYNNMFAYLIDSTIADGDNNLTAAMVYEIVQMLNHSTGAFSINYNGNTQSLTVSGNLNLDWDTVLTNLMPPIDPGTWPSPWVVADELNQSDSELFFFFAEVFLANRMNQMSVSYQFSLSDGLGIENITGSLTIPWANLLEDLADFENATVSDILPWGDDWWWNENMTITEFTHEIINWPGHEEENGYQKYEGGIEAIEYYINNYEASFIDGDYFWDYLKVNFNTTIKDLDISLNDFYWEHSRINNTGNTHTLGGLSIEPGTHSVNATWWDLNSLFEAEAGLYPGSGQQLGITVATGNNGTHHTILSYEGLTDPDDIVYDSEGNAIVMFWANATVGDLKDLRFSDSSGAVTGGYVNPDLLPYVMSDPSLNMRLQINNVSGATGITVTAATNMADEGDAWNPVGFFVNITTSETITSVDAWLTFYYTDAEVQAAGVDENSLQVFWWNPSTSAYEPISEVIRNTDQNWVSAHLTHLSVFVLFGATPIWTQAWFLATMGAIAAIIVVSIVAVFWRRRAGVIKGSKQP